MKLCLWVASGRSKDILKLYVWAASRELSGPTAFTRLPRGHAA